MPPKVSVIICTYNRARFISKAIDSVLKQTYENFELIIVDDASSDNTEKKLREYTNNPKIIIHKNKNVLGISKSRNLGVSLSHGEYIAMLDSDDEWTDPMKLEKQILILNEDSEIGLVGSSMIMVKDNGEKIKEEFTATTDAEIRKLMLFDNQIFQSSVMFRKKAFEEAGGYDEKLEVAEDYDLWLRIGKKYKFANLKESTINYTVHEGSVSKRKKMLMAKTVNNIVEKYKKDYSGYFKAKTFALLRIAKCFLF